MSPVCTGDAFRMDSRVEKKLMLAAHLSNFPCAIRCRPPLLALWQAGPRCSEQVTAASLCRRFSPISTFHLGEGGPDVRPHSISVSLRPVVMSEQDNRTLNGTTLWATVSQSHCDTARVPG